MNRHIVTTGPDGIRWVCIEPLQEDIVEATQKLMELPTDNLSTEDKHILDMKILSLRAIHEFLGSLLTADTLKQIREKHEDTTGSSLH